MKTGKSLLIEGIEALCQNDKEIENLITPRFEEIITLLERYIKEIELFNAAYGLVSVRDTSELIIRHILDSIAPLGIIFRLLRNNANIADAGSGAGFPGIPLAIILPDTEFTLIERMGRRAGFLYNTKAVLGVDNITIEDRELEALFKEKIKTGRFSLVTFRAFKPLQPKLIKILLNACDGKGLIAAYKGKREKIDAEMAQLEKTYYKGELPAWEAIPYKTPFLDEERHILTVRHS